MVDRKYNNILTAVLIVVVVAIIGVLGFYGYQTFKEYGQEKGAQTAIDEFDKVTEQKNTPTPVETQDQGETNTNGGSFNLGELKTEQPTANKNNKKVKIATTTYKGFTVAGKIEIPKINISFNHNSFLLLFPKIIKNSDCWRWNWTCAVKTAVKRIIEK